MLKLHKPTIKTNTLLCFILVFLLGLTACSGNPPKDKETAASSAAQIYLYGEQHGFEKILDKEIQLWEEAYQKKNMRHLFCELPFYTTEFLNLWMQSDSDEILDAVYDDWEGSAAHNPYIKSFYKKIKENCPETIFHGTDVGHQYATTGERYLAVLVENGRKDSEEYEYALKIIEQGKYYYEHSDSVYRENKMAENFTFALDKLDADSIMGFYGSAHVGLDSMDGTGTVPCMANQLKAIYGDTVHSEDLTWLAKTTEPVEKDIIQVGGKDYEASYFGSQDMTGFKDFATREFWRLENAYDEFKDKPTTKDVLPYDNYPMQIETGQVFLVRYTKTDGSVLNNYYRSDGNDWNGKPATEGFTAD